MHTMLRSEMILKRAVTAWPLRSMTQPFVTAAANAPPFSSSICNTLLSSSQQLLLLLPHALTLSGLAFLCALISSSVISIPSLPSTAALDSREYWNLHHVTSAPSPCNTAPLRSLAEQLHRLVVQHLCPVPVLLLLLLLLFGRRRRLDLLLFLLGEQFLPQKHQLTTEFRGRRVVRQHERAALLRRAVCSARLALPRSFAQLVAGCASEMGSEGL